MERFFCYGKKDFCPEEVDDCNECQFKNENGGIEEEALNEVIRGVFGDDYDLDRLRELVEADRDGRCVVLQKEAKLKKGDKVWYVDKENGEIESGTVFATEYKDGKLYSFSVDFDSGDFDEFYGSAWGDCFFASKKVAENEIRGG